MSANKNKIFTNLNDLSDLKKKLEIKINYDLCILNARKIDSIGPACQISDKELLKLLEALKTNVRANKIIIDWSISNSVNIL